MEDRTLEGRAYAVLEADGTLTLFRSDEAYAEGEVATTRDVLGTERYGLVWECPERFRHVLLPGWAREPEDARSILAVRVADGQGIAAPTSCKGWFYKCENMTEADLSGLDTSLTDDMSLMFAGCHSLEAFDPSPLDTSKVTNMDSMFRECVGLLSLDLSGLDLSCLRRAEDMFRDCTSLGELRLPPAPELASGTLMFERCDCLAPEGPDVPEDSRFMFEWLISDACREAEERG